MLSTTHQGLISVIYTAILLVISCLVVIHSGCIHDEIQHSSVSKQHVTYNTELRKKRATDTDLALFEQIRINLRFMLHFETLATQEEAKVRNAAERAANLLSSILSVVPVHGALLLTRNACQRQHSSGINQGKCAYFDHGYRGETCGDSAAEFLIPEEHLDGFSVWNASYSEPIKTFYEPGLGVDADYIMYITARSVRSCLQQGTNVLAFAKYCQLDQNDRPIAGTINFCPQHLSDEDITEEKIYQIALHEFFHAFGFTKDLFHKFKTCEASLSTLNCTDRLNPIRTVLGVERLVTPTVAEISKEHFGCNRDDYYGVPLQDLGGTYGSHWDAKAMQGSIMAPSLAAPHLTVIDNITLAAFQDMGWYHVDFSYAQRYLWGIGEGCEFGLESMCGFDSDYFCTGNGTGCHYLHTDKGVCDASPTLGVCRIYRAVEGDECFISSNLLSTSHLHGEVYDKKSRCFLSNITEDDANGSPSVIPLDGRCYKHRCNDTRILEVKLQHGDWKICPYGTSIQFPGYNGVLMCPNEGILCMEEEQSSTTLTVTPLDQVSTEPSIRTDQPPPPDLHLRIEIRFADADYQELAKNSRLKQKFQDGFKLEVIKQTDVAPHRIVHLKIQKGSVVTAFDVLPPHNDSTGPPPQLVYEILDKCVTAGNFTVIIAGEDVSYTASSIKTVLIAPRGPPPFPAGAIVGIVIGGLIVFTGVVVSIVLVNKVKNRGRISPTVSRVGSLVPEPSGGHSVGLAYSVAKASLTASADSIGTAPSQENLAMNHMLNGVNLRKRTSSLDSNLDGVGYASISRPVSMVGIVVHENNDIGCKNGLQNSSYHKPLKDAKNGNCNEDGTHNASCDANTTDSGNDKLITDDCVPQLNKSGDNTEVVT